MYSNIFENKLPDFFNTESLILALFLIALIVFLLTKRFRLPYTVGLVIIGLLLPFFSADYFRSVNMSPDFIMYLLLPPLLFEASFHIRVDDLKRDIWMILTLAVPGVILSTFVVSGIVHWGTGIALPAALVFGSLIAATDPVAVVALFKQLGVPKRLQVLLEGESLFNDGTAVVLFGLMLELGENGLSIVQGIVDFIVIAGGGTLLGALLGLAASQAVRRINEPLVETTITTILAFGAYIIGEKLQISGVLAVVVAGIVSGNVSPRGMSPTTRIVVHNFWEYIAFLANSIIFLIIGLTIQLDTLIHSWQAIIVAIFSVLLARVIGIYGLSSFQKKIPFKWKHTLFWGGLRGAIVLALALNIPETFAEKDQLIAMAYGVVLFTLLIQGITMEPLVKRMKLVQRTSSQEQYEERHARLVATRSAFEHLAKLNRQGVLSDHTWLHMKDVFQQREKNMVQALQEVLIQTPTVELSEFDKARSESLRVQRAMIENLYREGSISDEIHERLISEVDQALTDDHVNWSHLLKIGSNAEKNVEKMMAVIIQEIDLEKALKALSSAGFGIDHFPSTGTFLNRRNVTLVIGAPENRVTEAVEILEKACERRIKYLRTPTPLFPFMRPAPVEVGGATIFTFDVEAYHEF